MPWFDQIDPTRPADTEFVSEGAMRFRELKRALIEQLSTAYEGFPGDSTHQPGEPLLFPIVSVMVGTFAQRPAVPTRQGHGWFDPDTGILYVGTRELVWQAVGVGDTNSLVSHRGFRYSPDELAAADRLGTAREVGEVLDLIIDGTTTALGTIGVDLTDFNPLYDSSKVVSVVVTPGFYGSSNAGRTIGHDTASSDPPEDMWFFRVANETGAAVVTTPVKFHAVFAMEPITEEVP